MRDPYRRAAFIVLLLGGSVYMAWRSTTQAWFTMTTLEGPVDLTLSQVATLNVVSSPVGGQPAVYAVFGVPAPLGWLVIGMLLAGTSFVLRLSVLGVLAIGASWMARAATVSAYTLLIGPTGQGNFSLAADGLTGYLGWVWAAMLLELVLAVQLTYARYREKQAAIARGEDHVGGLLETVHTVQAVALGRFGREKRN